MKRYRPYILLVSVVLSVLLAGVGAASALATVRTVDVLAVFAGAFGAGAALTAYVHERKAGRPSGRR